MMNVLPQPWSTHHVLALVQDISAFSLFQQTFRCQTKISTNTKAQTPYDLLPYMSKCPVLLGSVQSYNK